MSLRGVATCCGAGLCPCSATTESNADTHKGKWVRPESKPDSAGGSIEICYFGNFILSSSAWKRGSERRGSINGDTLRKRVL